MAKISIFSFYNGKDDWIDEGLNTYQKKISFFNEFEIRHFKSPKFSREQKDLKMMREGEILLEHFSKYKGQIVLLDEMAKPQTTPSFSKWLGKKLETSQPLSFVVGGAYGFSPAVKKYAQEKISLSSLTFSHSLAELILVEQIYRAFSLLKNTPYHNE